MSTHAVKTRVKQLLSTLDPEAIALNGRWGVGKTFFWNQAIRELATAKKLALQKYAYVSLFGINNLDQLKSSIFEYTIQTANIVEGITVRSVTNNVRNFFSQWSENEKPKTADSEQGSSRITELGKSLFRKATSVAGSLPQVQGYAALVRAGAFLMVRDTLICIDDLERKGSTLEIRDVMGLVSFLKEQRKCKVVIIFNEGAMDGQAVSQYSEYREKVVDIQLEYRPLVREAVLLAFSEDSPEFAKILPKAEILKLTNIRVLQKIKRTLQDLASVLDGLVAETKDNVLHTVVLMSWAYFSRETGGPTIEYITSLDSSEMWGREEEKKQSIFQKAEAEQDLTEAQEKRRLEKEKLGKWKDTLRIYGWQYTDELDRLIARHIERGYADHELEVQLKRKDQDYRGGKAQIAVEQAWKKFNESFNDNEEDLVTNLVGTSRAHVRYMGRDQLNSVVSLLRQLNKDELANSLSDLFVDTNRDRPEMFKTESFFGDEKEIDPYLAQKFFHARGLTEKPPQIHEVVERIRTNDSWGSTDEQFLASLSTEDIYAFLKAQHTMHLHAYIRVLLRFGEFGNSTDQQKGIALRTSEALKRIAKESTLNALRVRRYKVEDK